jgi:hypothetical protein
MWGAPVTNEVANHKAMAADSVRAELAQHGRQLLFVDHADSQCFATRADDCSRDAAMR